MKKKYKCVLSYDGTNFSGFQIQPNHRTIHGELEKALKKIHKGTNIKIQASGRTDAGVHARGQTFQFESTYAIPLANWRRALNTLLPHEMFIHEVIAVPSDFHVRYDVVEKEYRYFVLNKKETDVFRRNYVHQFPYELDIKAMQQACSYLIGTHDFTTFSSARATIKGSKVRTLTKASCLKQGSEIEFIFRGDGFLYNMVRIIIGVLLDIGQGRRKPADIDKLLSKRDRRFVGETVPPEGLYLWDVSY